MDGYGWMGDLVLVDVNTMVRLSRLNVVILERDQYGLSERNDDHQGFSVSLEPLVVLVGQNLRSIPFGWDLEILRLGSEIVRCSTGIDTVLGERLS